MDSLPAVVLAAGEGRRLRPLTRNRPKPKLPVLSKPILEHVFDALVDTGVTEFVVVVGYGRNRIQSYFGSSYRDVPITYVVQERQLGTGDALLQAEPAVDGTCLVVNGDQIVDASLVEDVLAAHEVTDVVATLGLLARTEIGEFGGVLLDDDRVVEIVDAPSDDRNYRLNAGVYALEPRAFEALPATAPRGGEHMLTEAFRWLLRRDESVRGVVSGGEWINVTYPWDLLGASVGLIREHGPERFEDPPVAPSAFVHESAVVSPSTIIEAGCEIGPGAVVGPYVTLRENVTVRSNAVVEGSIVDVGARIGQNATVIDGIIGQGVQIGPGTVISGGSSDVRVGDRIHRDVRLGALLADRVSDDGGVTYGPGTVVGPKAHLRAGVTVSGHIASETEVYG